MYLTLFGALGSVYLLFSYLFSPLAIEVVRYSIAEVDIDLLPFVHLFSCFSWTIEGFGGHI